MHQVKNWVTLFIILLTTTFIFLTFSPYQQLVHYINVLFYVFLLLLIVCLFTYTKKNGFFDGVTFGFRRFYHIMKQDDLLDEWKEKRLPSEKVNISLYKVMQFQTIATGLLLVLLMCLYYLI
ncbi:DUF3899 domain-containing protein [Pontibacillus litoralis]|uniref:DUF3899 domain-containing protein n=1 Tax=Pontibacillus litoralis JSM 072002 TaxID=1385512 RepID=A0A0A5G9M0_9BACI|nr:DUF3899 domain-containing protein [Pontibacillus litoralis]KGX87810.1 hypothetical protein N784_13995 [Pontibacillus litoralis JSM 072002]